VQHIGQVIGVVVADTVMQARRAARKVVLHIEPLPAVLDVRDALKAESYVLPPVFVKRGDAAAALKKARTRCTARSKSAARNTSTWKARSPTRAAGAGAVAGLFQHPAPGRDPALGLACAGHGQPCGAVECRRMGGGFGGKETQSGQMAVWAALAAHKLQAARQAAAGPRRRLHGHRQAPSVCLRLRRGLRRHRPLTGLKLMMAANCGFSADLSGPVADRAVFHADNAYFLEDVEIASYRCKTNTQSNTAFRGFGGPQGMIVIEAIMGDIARSWAWTRWTCARPTSTASATANVTHYQMKVEDNILEPLLAKTGAVLGYRQRREAIAPGTSPAR
jgi:xanthine dehydrogenase large subunit